MKWILVYFVALFGLAQLAGCNTPITWANKYNNLLTPDRLGVGVSNGTMDAHGVSNKFLNNQEEPIHMDIDGETYSTSIWLEWDFPQWEEKPDYDEYLRQRIRTLHLEKILLQKEQEIKDISLVDRYRAMGQEEMFPNKLTEQYGTGGG